MRAGVPVQRHWVVVLKSGSIAIDWGGGLYLDLGSDQFVELQEAAVSHTAQASDLDYLIRTSRLASYDAQQAWFINLPQHPFRTME